MNQLKKSHRCNNGLVNAHFAGIFPPHVAFFTSFYLRLICSKEKDKITVGTRVRPENPIYVKRDPTTVDR